MSSLMTNLQGDKKFTRFSLTSKASSSETSNRGNLNNYSHETLSFLNGLMNKSNLSRRQQRELLTCLNQSPGNSLPVTLPSLNKYPKTLKSISCSSMVTCNGENFSRLRSREQILRQCNAYEIEKFRPTATRNRENEIKRLQKLMSGEKCDSPMNPKEVRKVKVTNNDAVDPYKELEKEIEEREEWLKEMERLGQGKLYHAQIQFEIQIRKRELEKLKNQGKSKIAFNDDEACFTK